MLVTKDGGYLDTLLLLKESRFTFEALLPDTGNSFVVYTGDYLLYTVRNWLKTIGFKLRESGYMADIMADQAITIYLTSHDRQAFERLYYKPGPDDYCACGNISHFVVNEVKVCYSCLE